MLVHVSMRDIWPFVTGLGVGAGFMWLVNKLRGR